MENDKNQDVKELNESAEMVEKDPLDLALEEI